MPRVLTPRQADARVHRHSEGIGRLQFIDGGGSACLAADRQDWSCVCVFHAAADGGEWQFVQHFALEADGTSRVDILAQSPTGEGCEVPFSELRFAVERLADTRSGL